MEKYLGQTRLSKKSKYILSPESLLIFMSSLLKTALLYNLGYKLNHVMPLTGLFKYKLYYKNSSQYIGNYIQFFRPTHTNL